MKSANYNDFYRYLNTYFSTTINFICSIRVPIRSSTFVKDDLVKKTNVVADPSIKIPTVRSFKNCLILLTCLDKHVDFSQ